MTEYKTVDEVREQMIKWGMSTYESTDSQYGEGFSVGLFAAAKMLNDAQIVEESFACGLLLGIALARAEDAEDAEDEDLEPCAYCYTPTDETMVGFTGPYPVCKECQP